LTHNKKKGEPYNSACVVGLLCASVWHVDQWNDSHTACSRNWLQFQYHCSPPQCTPDLEDPSKTSYTPDYLVYSNTAPPKKAQLLQRDCKILCLILNLCLCLFFVPYACTQYAAANHCRPWTSD